MQGAYFTYFENPFRTLRMGRPAFKAQGQYTHRAIAEAALGKAFDPLLAALDQALAGFDENLATRNQPTAGTTEAWRTARTEWLTFVEDTAIDYVKPKLPAYADFKKYGKSKLAELDQDHLLTDSADLLKLYAAHQDALYPGLVADAQKKLKALGTLDDTRDRSDSTTAAAILDLGADWEAIARAQRRLKAQLELTFDDPEKVCSFFDFSKAKVNKSGKVKVVVMPPAAG